MLNKRQARVEIRIIYKITTLRIDQYHKYEYGVTL